MRAARHDGGMDARRVGRVLRAVRLHKRLRQIDVTLAAGVSQSVVSRAEHARLDELSFEAVDAVASALDVTLFIDARWDDGDAYRLIDRAHAQIVELVVATLTANGWETVVEYGFNHYGDRGSVDVLAWHAESRTLLIVEVKSRLTDLQATFTSFARKLRIVPGLVLRDHGWDSRFLGRLIVIEGTTANRTVVAKHAATFTTLFPDRMPAIGTWLRRPDRSLGGVWFVSNIRGANAKQVRHRRERSIHA
jgi:transcriptional regulator with XRE-family HTH domain